MGKPPKSWIDPEIQSKVSADTDGNQLAQSGDKS